MAKVIVIDDSLSVCFAIERMLRSRGMEVISHRSGEAALENLEPEQPDLVLCDLVLPDIEGFQICTFIKQSPVLNNVPVIVISGIVDEEIRAQAKDVGAEAVLKKPFASDEMLTLVEDILRRRGILEADDDEAPTGPVAVEADAEEEAASEEASGDEPAIDGFTVEEDDVPTGPVSAETDEDEDDTAPVMTDPSDETGEHMEAPLDLSTESSDDEPEEDGSSVDHDEQDGDAESATARAPRILLATPDPRNAPAAVSPPPEDVSTDPLLDELEERLAPLASIEALRFACILSPEGELRGYGPAKPTATDLAALPQLMRAATNTATHTRQGEVGILTLETDKGVLVVKPQEEGHLMILGLGDLSVLGKARYLLRRLEEA